MVFESIVADLLNRFLGDYVENLDRSQLKIGIWGGDVVLENLHLKDSALENLDLPVKTTFGHLGKLVLKIPWKNLYSAPVEASIERLYLLAVPNRDVKYDADKEATWAHNAKMAELARIEEAKKLEREKDKPKPDDTFVEKLATQIIKNVQVKIQDIHVRYEDRHSSSKPFSVGFTLHNLSVQTTSENWVPCVVQDAVTLIHKVLALEGLAIYWNPNTPFYGEGTPEQILKRFHDGICTKSMIPTGYSYILGPINSTSRLKLNPKPETDGSNFTIPKVQLNLRLEKLAIGLGRLQYLGVLDLVDSMEQMTLAAPYRKFRPDLNTYRGHYKEWWHYANACIMERVKRRRRDWSWDHIFNHRSMCRKYASLYKTKLTIKKMPADQQKALDQCEKELDVFNIVIIRQKIELEVEKEGRKQAEKKAASGWFGGWFGGGGTPAPAEEDMSAAAIGNTTEIIAKKFEEAMTPEEKAKLYQAIDYQENVVPSYPVEFVAMNLEFVLECLEVTVKDSAQRVVDVALHRVTTTVHQRPAAQAIKVVTKVHEFVVSGSKQNGSVPKLAVPWETDEDKALWNILFETNPLDKSCDQRIHVNAKPLKIVYDAQTINNVVEVFKKPAEVNLSQLQAAAGARFDDLREMSATGLQHAIQKHTILDLQVDLQAPYILIPRTGFYTGSEDLLVVVLGGLRMASLPRDQSQADIKAMISLGSTEKDVLETMMSRSYDNFKIGLSNIQILMAEVGEDWKCKCDAGLGSAMHLLQPSSLNIGFSKCLIADDPRLPKMKVTGELPNISIDISEKRLISLLSLVKSIPTPGQDEEPPPSSESLSRSSSITTLHNLWVDATARKEEKPKQPEDGQKELVQSIEVDVRFHMGDLKVNVFQNLPDNTVRKLMDFSVIRLELEFTQRTFDMTAAVRLGGLGLNYHDVSETLQLLSTPITSGREEYLLGITFTSVDKKSPELRTRHGSVLQFVELNFTTLDILLHQEALVAIMEFANSLTSKLSEVKPNVPDTPTVKEVLPKLPLPAILEDEEAEVIVPRARPKKKSVVETIDFKLQANMKDLNLHIANRSQRITDLIVAGLETRVLVKKSYTEVIAVLKTLLVLDPKEETIHHKILSVVGNEAFSMQLVMYNLEEGKFNPDEVNMSVRLDMGCLRIVFLNWFVSSLLTFVNTFQEAQRAVADAAAEAAEAAAQNVKEMRAQAVRIALAIKLKAPVIIVPAHSKSLDALLLDFGDLSINNKFQTLNEKNKHGDPAVVDELHLTLHNLKMSRVRLKDDANEVSAECLMLQPISCGIVVQRNLSSDWYKNIPDIEISGRLETISITLSQEDYKTTMSVLTGNLAEGPPKAPPPPVEHKQIEWNGTGNGRPSRPNALAGLRKVSVTTVETEKTLESSPISTYTSMKFSFTMDSLVINLYTGGAKDLEKQITERDPTTGLGRFTLHVLAIKGRMLSDDSLSTSVLLVDCLLDDTRHNTSAKITRLMESREDLHKTPTGRPVSSGSEPSVKSMLDLTFQQKGSDMFVDVRVFGFTLILSVDYFVRIADFFTSGLPETKPGPPPVQQQNAMSGRKSHASIPKQPESAPSKTMMTVNLKVEKPDIILVESMENLDASAIILNTEVVFKLRTSEDHQVMNGTIKDLQLYSCCFHPKKRKETMAEILRPCSISLAGSTPQGEGMHIEVSLSDIALGVSPGTIELLTRIQTALTEAQQKEDETVKAEPDYSDIWTPKTFQDTDFWFLKTEMGEDVMAIEYIPTVVTPPPSGEILILTAPSIVITVEAGVGSQTLPMILLDVGFQGTVANWSSELAVESSMSVQMAYYNSALAVWEPLIEPVEVLRDGRPVHIPWEIVAMVHKNTPEVIGSPKSPTAAPDTEEIPFRPPGLSIDICSKETLELTMTKTCLDMLSNLGKAFQSAVNEGVTARIGAVAPYLVINDTGLSITVKLEDGPFQPLENQPDGEYKQIMLGSGARVGLALKEPEHRNYRSMLIGGVELDSKVQEKFLSIRINERAFDLQLPVVRANKRYFNLRHRGEGNDFWGLVSDVQVKDGGTVITLRSIIQVHNHFQEPIAVYYMTKRGNEVECVGTVEPGGKLNLPLYAVYTPTNELFFSVEGYTVSVVPFVWKELQNQLATSKLLQCEPKKREDKEPFYIKVVGEMEQIYFEDTTRHTMISTCYNLHLRPAVIIKNYLPVDMICFVEGLATERPLPAGGHIQLPTAEPGKTNVVLRLPDYLEKEWSCKHEIVNNAPEFAVWTFESYDSVQKVCIDLGMHTVTKNGSITMSLYCPFWMLNKTGLMLSYRQSDETANVLYHPADFKGPVLFSFKAKSFFGKKKASIKVEEGEWSDKFSLDVAGSSGMVTCKAGGMIYQIGVHIQMTYSSLTNQVIFTPYHVIINRAGFELECREAERTADPWVSVKPEECSPFWPRSTGNIKEMVVRVKGTSETTEPFSFASTHTTLLKLQNKYGGINIDVQMMEGSVYLTFESYKHGLAPALVMNHTSKEVQLWEKGSANICKLQPKQMAMITWEKPTGARQIVWNAGKKKEINDDLRKDGIGEYTPTESDKSYWVSFLDGMQRVLLFTDEMAVARDAQAAGELETVDQEITISIYGVGFSLVNNVTCAELLYVGIASSGVIWETCKVKSKRFKPLSMKDCLLIEDAYQKYLSEIQLGGTPSSGRVVIADGKTEVDFENEEMLKPNRRRLRRTFQTGLWFQMKTSPNQTQLHAKLNRLQIDNQMYDCIFPVILAPVPPPKSVAADSALKPFTEVSIVRRVVPYSTVQQYKYFKVLVQEFHVKVDIGFVNALLELFEAGDLTEEQEAERFAEDRGVVDKPLLAHVSLQSSQEQKNFYDLLHFSPLKVHLSFSLSDSSHKSVAPQQGSQILNVFMQTLGVTLTDVQDVIFKLAYFERQYTFLTQKQLISEATMHYVGQSLKQLYVLVLGLDVIGNPYGLVVGLTEGVGDLFYEPFQGAIQGPGEFAEGLVLGVRSLFGHTVGGAAGAVSRITDAMGKGIAALTFDKEFQRKRREAMHQRPANIQTGLAQSGKGLVMGVVGGVSGVIMKPISGAKEEGVEGFFKGVGKGMVGLVARPTAGVIDFASGSLEAVKRVAEMSEETTRLRPPRYFQQDGLVRPYVRLQAEGNKLLQEVDKGRYASTDVYIHHVFIGKDVLMLTDKRVLYIVKSEIFGGWQVDWDHTWASMTSAPRVVDRGVFISTGEPKKKVLGLFGSSETGKVILIKDPDLKQWLVLKMEELMMAK